MSLRSGGRNIEHLGIQKFLQHLSVENMIVPYLTNLKNVKLQHSVLSNVREGVKDHLVVVKNFKIVMAKDILCTFALGLDVGIGRGMACLLGVDRRNITKAWEKRTSLDSMQDAFWLHNRRKPHCNLLPQDIRATVEQWWAQETTVSPNQKDIVTKK